MHLHVEMTPSPLPLKRTQQKHKNKTKRILCTGLKTRHKAESPPMGEWFYKAAIRQNQGKRTGERTTK